MKQLIGCLILAGISVPCVAQIRVVSYNTLDGPTPGVHDNAANMSTVFGAIAIDARNGIARRPDLIILQEQTTTSAATLAALLNSQFGGANYIAVTPSGQPGSSDPKFLDRQSFVYDSTTLTRLGSAISVPTGALRPVIRAQFQPVGYSSSDASFFAYGAHLMSSSSPDRSLQTAAMRANSNGLGNVHAIYAGDFNMQSNSEAGWQNLVTGAGAGLAIDPLNPANAAQTWNNNAAFASIHTQSTRTSTTPDGDFGATGGMDDRFDVQLFTEEFFDDEGLAFIQGSYRAFGNDGLHFNAAINASPTIPQGAVVANALWDGSDHLPVVVDYQLPAKMAVTVESSPSPRVIVGGEAAGSFRVQNTAPVTVALAADELDYTQSPSGAATGSFSGTVMAASAGDLRVAGLDTVTPGAKSGTVTFASNSQGVENPTASFEIQTLVLDNAAPSFDSASFSDTFSIDFGIRGLSEVVNSAPVSLFNRVTTPGLTADLDLDQIISGGDSAALLLSMTIGGGISAGDSRDGSASINTETVGEYSASYDLRTSDEDLPGATQFASLVLELRGRVALFGDATLDNTVNLDDFTTLAANFGGTDKIWQQGDFTHDGSVTLDDFTLLAVHFGQTAAGNLRTVPEPLAMPAIAIVSMLAWRRRRR